MRAGNVFSLVKRTLFETNSKARRLGKAGLTSVLTWRLLLASLMSVNPEAANIAPTPRLGSHAKIACNFLASFFKGEEESDRLSAVFSAGFVQKGGHEWQKPPLPEESARERQ
ncbi:hypothetical protein RFM99_34845 [Mesorhizobium sp. VK4C]|uniref:hypothetical protein n=1 Tax=Mesorhizobium captivum TaxID=3072319 RepID=UPI002A24AD1B|nr:hypothetical protein [Mesorhizobium sp. VK4C]MDX8503533.1 hypothetical protein [Mesorhizobium sp. VK4C]